METGRAMNGHSASGGQEAACLRCTSPLPPGAPFCPACGERADGPPPFEGEPATSMAPRVEREARVAVAAPRITTPRAPATDATRAVEAGPTSPLPVELDGYRHRLQETFGYPDFRDGQARVLEGLGRGDVLAVMPTGSGKSLCYVLPALEVRRAVVVSPLIALMQDQVESLQAAGVPATFINSNLGRDEQNRRYLDFIEGRAPLLYVAPERFANHAFTAGLARAGVNLFAIDEAHCISEWGHNFRPDYLQLGAIRERLGSPRTLALTATANPQVRRDIAQRLGLLGRATEVVTTVDRPNLAYAVERVADEDERIAWLASYVRAHRGEAGVIYARSRRLTEKIATELRSLGAAHYHAGMEKQTRSRVQRRFTLGEIPVIVATNAFGMGIDKPDVRFVVHVNMPGRLEAYYQEAGRAGRDGDPAECTLLYDRRDRTFQRRLIGESHPDAAAVRQTWQRWVQTAHHNDGYLPRGTSEDDPERFAITVAALRDSGLLEPVALRLTSMDPDAPIDTSSIERHRQHAEERLREMTEYAETTGCRRAVILRYFGEQAPERCGRCDNCLRPPEEQAAEFADDLYDAILAIRDDIARQSKRQPSRVLELRTARELAARRPRTREDLTSVWGIGRTRVEWFGDRLLRTIEEWEAAHPDAAPPTVEPARKRRRRDDAGWRAEIRGGRPSMLGGERSAGGGPEVSPDDPLFETLRAWRQRHAREEGVPAFTLFSDRTLRELATRRPRDTAGLLQVWGLGEARVQRFGDDLLEVIREAARP
ncbi:MAG: RecQ family ATP-dependent DNA helicase [Dehalococcoidia bacterium]|nr:RecQ family ATP-dependent DNA helicase [Dehalococcoidia bacterium]